MASAGQITASKAAGRSRLAKQLFVAVREAGWVLVGAPFLSSYRDRTPGPREHYTTEKNILELIEQLLIDDLRAEFQR